MVAKFTNVPVLAMVTMVPTVFVEAALSSFVGTHSTASFVI